MAGTLPALAPSTRSLLRAAAATPNRLLPYHHGLPSAFPVTFMAAPRARLLGLQRVGGPMAAAQQPLTQIGQTLPSPAPRPLPHRHRSRSQPGCRAPEEPALCIHRESRLQRTDPRQQAGITEGGGGAQTAPAPPAAWGQPLGPPPLPAPRRHSPKSRNCLMESGEGEKRE